MTQDAKLYFIHATSPIHAGVGSGLGAINLPTARERWTGYPFVPGSSVKGVLRDAAERLALTEPQVCGAFGPTKDNAADARGGLVFSDASLLALPVRSLFATFAWVTCPYVLGRLARDAREAGGPGAAIDAALTALAGASATAPLVASTAALDPVNDGLYLEELRLPAATPSSDVATVAAWIAGIVWPSANPTPPSTLAGAKGAASPSSAMTFFRDRLIVVTDDLFGFFTRTATEIRHRVAIDDRSGTAAASGPWTEEYLPAEALLHGLVIGRATQYVDPKQPGPSRAGTPVSAQTVLATLTTVLSRSTGLRFGGKATAGMGRAHMQVAS